MTSKRSRRTIGYVAIASLIIRLALITVFAPMGQAALNAMPANAAAGQGFELVMCSVHGPMTLAVDPRSQDDESDPDKAEKPRFCPFCAGVSAVAWAIEPAQQTFAYPASERQTIQPRLVRIAHNLDTPPPTARGPPSIQI